MAGRGTMKILAVCKHCRHILYEISDNGIFFDGSCWTKQETVKRELARQARMNFKKGLQVKRVSSCEVCRRWRHYVSALV